jgi:hypothetical protein
VCELAAGHVLAVAVKAGTRAPLSREVLLPGSLLPQGMEAARLLFLCRVQMAKAPGLLVPQALPSLRASPVPRALVSHARPLANRPVELLSRQEAHARLYLAGQAKPAVYPRPQSLDSRQQPVARCRQVAQPHELAAECSSDFQP